jgi:hypothetical protein
MSNAEGDIAQQGRALVARLLAQPDSGTGRDYNNLLSLFFRGLPTGLLEELLRSSHKDVIGGALFIAEELAEKAAPVRDAVLRHLTHEDASIRYSAYYAVASASRGTGAFSHVVAGLRDQDAPCRKIVMLWMIRVDESTLASASRAMEPWNTDHDLQRGLQMLLEGGQDYERVKSWILDARPLIRKIGVIAAGRAARTDSGLLALAADSDDSDVRNCAIAHRHFLAIFAKHEKKRRNRERGDR